MKVFVCRKEVYPDASHYKSYYVSHCITKMLYIICKYLFNFDETEYGLPYHLTLNGSNAIIA